MPISQRPASTIRLCLDGGSSPSARAGIGGSDPSFTPMRIEIARSVAALTTSRTLSASRMLPGLRRRPWMPPSIDVSASRWSKWISAISGTGVFATISGTAAAARLSGTAMRTISAPASARRAICSIVALASAVSVFVIVCTTTGASPPTCTSPTCTGRDLRRSLRGFGSSVIGDSFIGVGRYCDCVLRHLSSPSGWGVGATRRGFHR